MTHRGPFQPLPFLDSLRAGWPNVRRGCVALPVLCGRRSVRGRGAQPGLDPSPRGWRRGVPPGSREPSAGARARLPAAAALAAGDFQRVLASRAPAGKQQPPGRGNHGVPLRKALPSLPAALLQALLFRSIPLMIFFGGKNPFPHRTARARRGGGCFGAGSARLPRPGPPCRALPWPPCFAPGNAENGGSRGGGPASTKPCLELTQSFPPQVSCWLSAFSCLPTAPSPELSRSLGGC